MFEKILDLGMVQELCPQILLSLQVGLGDWGDLVLELVHDDASCACVFFSSCVCQELQVGNALMLVVGLVVE